MLKSVFIFLLLVVFCGGAAGQKAGRVKVSGTVKTTDGVSAEFINVQLKNTSSVYVFTHNGNCF